jgi:Domain of unknown function (DUF397)
MGTWRKSSFSTDQTNCVEVGVGARIVGIRDSKQPAGKPLTIPATAFRALCRTFVPTTCE